MLILQQGFAGSDTTHHHWRVDKNSSVSYGECMVSDLLRIDHINSLPQPFMAVFYGGDSWPLEDIDVQSGLLRIDVCGKLQVRHIGEVKHFVDATGETHSPDTWYR